MRTVVYVRVSTLRQAQAQTIEQQLDRLRACFRSRGVELAGEDIFRDDGYSGATLNRPGLDRLRDAVRAREVEQVLVTDPDRLARNYVQLMVLLEELERFGCRVEFLDRPMGRDPQDQLLLQIRGAVAEYERTLIAERMRRGRQIKLRTGCLLPWTRAPYGYRVDPDRPRDPAGITVEPAEAAVVREVFARYVEDHASLFSLAGHLRVLGIPSPTGRRCWSTATLRGMLTNPTYTGQVFANRWHARAPRTRRSATHPIGRPSDSAVPTPTEQWLPVASIPALISSEQFERAQAKLAQNRAFARRHNTRHNYLLRALVSCGVCQPSCLCRTVHPGYDYYICRGKADPIHSRRDEPCPARYAPAQRLDDLVWQDLCALLTEPEHIAQALARAHGGGWLPQELQARREQLRQGQLGLARQLERLTEAYQLGVIPLPEYQRRRQTVEDKAKALHTQADQLEAQVDRQAQLAGWAASAADFCRRVQTGLADANFTQRRQLVELLVDRVVVTDGEVEIRYVIPLSPDGERGRFCHLRKDYFDAPPLAVVQGAQVARPFGHGNDPGFGMAGIVNDADVGAHPSGREFNVLQIERPLLGAGRRRGRFGSIEHRQVALQAQPVVPGPPLAPADQVGGAVEAIAHEPDPRALGQPRGHRLQERLLGFEADGPLRRLNPPRQRHRSLAKAQRQHQNLVAVGELGLVQDQNHGIAQRRRLFQNLARERLHDLVADDQGIAEKPRDPLVAHVRPVGGARQPGRQVHQVRAAHVQHRRHQQRQLLPLRLTLAGEPSLEVRADAVCYPGEAVHNTGPGSAEGEILESHADSSRQPRPVRNSGGSHLNGLDTEDWACVIRRHRFYPWAVRCHGWREQWKGLLGVLRD